MKYADTEKISISNRKVLLQTIIRRLKQGTIIIPPIQYGVKMWDNEQQSQFIETLMLKIPVQSFYVVEDESAKWKVVDGLQRIIVIDRYILHQKFALSGLEFLYKLEQFKFDSLPLKYQNYLLNTEFQFIIINPSTSQNAQRIIFKRLNTRRSFLV